MADFKPQNAEQLAKDATSARPPATAKTNNLHRSRSVTVDQMGFAKEDLAQVPEVVRHLSVNDLEDFAKRMAGLPTRNQTVEKLTVQDMQGIEFLFAQEKNAILHQVALKVGVKSLAAVSHASDVNVSCCCCTPCCCCAATEVHPFAA